MVELAGVEIPGRKTAPMRASFWRQCVQGLCVAVGA